MGGRKTGRVVLALRVGGLPRVNASTAPGVAPGAKRALGGTYRVVWTLGLSDFPSTQIHWMPAASSSNWAGHQR